MFALGNGQKLITLENYSALIFFSNVLVCLIQTAHLLEFADIEKSSHYFFVVGKSSSTNKSTLRNMYCLV